MTKNNYKILKYKFLRQIGKLSSAALFIFATISCVEEFKPSLNTEVKLLVIDGSIIKGESVQKVYISRSTSIYYPEFTPISECNVWVEDKLGNSFFFDEMQPGIYESEIPPQYLSYKSEFQLHVIAPGNKEYRSDFEPILESSPVDSVYFINEYNQSGSEQHSQGLQFYTDLKAPEGASKNYLWLLEETFENHTSYNIDGYWNENDIVIPEYSPVSDSINICWTSYALKEFFTSSTQNLSINEKKKIPLNYLPETSPKINIKYSLLVKQYALSDKAYQYWDQKKIAAVESGGLYQSQPSQSKSNVYNINNPEEIVLGYFWASSYSQKRIFFTGPLTTINSDCEYIVPCVPQIGQTLLEFFQGLDKSVFLIALDFSSENADSVSLWGFPFNQTCIDCTAEGGKTEKPEFWK